MKGFASHYHIESGDDDLFVKTVKLKQLRIENGERVKLSILNFSSSVAMLVLLPTPAGAGIVAANPWLAVLDRLLPNGL